MTMHSEGSDISLRGVTKSVGKCIEDVPLKKFIHKIIDLLVCDKKQMILV